MNLHWPAGGTQPFDEIKFARLLRTNYLLGMDTEKAAQYACTACAVDHLPPLGKITIDLADGVVFHFELNWRSVK